MTGSPSIDDPRSPDSSPDQGSFGTATRASSSPSVLVRGVYFILIGWWASGIWLGFAWFFIVTIIGMPIGIKMINVVPKIVSLKSRTLQTDLSEDADGNRTVTESTRDQHSLIVRAVYFLLIGWWASGVWMGVAWLVSITIIGLPVAVWMYDRLPFVVSLYKY